MLGGGHQSGSPGKSDVTNPTVSTLIGAYLRLDLCIDAILGVDPLGLVGPQPARGSLLQS